MKAVRIHEQGSADKMVYEEVPTPEPGEGQLQVKLAAVGLNFKEVYQRAGLYKVPLPFVMGGEASGEVTAVGAGASGFSVGDRVCYTGVNGAYAEYHCIPAARAIKVPDGMDHKQGAAIMLQGLTAHYLSHDSYSLNQGDWCLIHAGAGGVGLLLIQMAKMRGANVITTVSTEEKAELARGAGADHVINYTNQNFEEETLKIVGDRKLDTVYDSVGKDTFDGGLNLLRPRGTMVLFGQSSGPVPSFDLNRLNAKGSLYVTRPSLDHHIASRADLEKRANEVLSWVAADKLKVRIGAEFPLSEVAKAHMALEGRKTTGKVLLIP